MSPGLFDAIAGIPRLRLADSNAGGAENQDEGHGKKMFCEFPESAECGVSFQGKPNLVDVKTQEFIFANGNRFEIIALIGRA
jgi:hypothetical protein